MMLTKIEGPTPEGNKIYTFGGQYSLEVPQRYNVKSIIGRGAYGLVCSAVNTENGRDVAIKKIGRLFEDPVDAKRVLREIKLLNFLDHPNVLGLEELCRPVDRAGFSDLYVITELMEKDMHALLRSSHVQLTAGHCQYFALQLLCALQHLHSARVVHRDLKPGNLLTDSECNLKLCDFGLARGLGSTMTNYVVTRWYRPPELLFVSSHYDERVDLWSTGCLAAEMITGKTLFAGQNYIHQINLIVELLGKPSASQLPHEASEEAVRYIQSLPEARPKTLAAFCPELRRRFDDASFLDSFDDEGSVPAASQAPGAAAAYYAHFEDFISHLLQYNPTQRWSAKACIAHPWLADVMGGSTEVPDCDAKRAFVWAHDDDLLTVPQLRSMFLEEIDNFQHDNYGIPLPTTK